MKVFLNQVYKCMIFVSESKDMQNHQQIFKNELQSKSVFLRDNYICINTHFLFQFKPTNKIIKHNVHILYIMH